MPQILFGVKMKQKLSNDVIKLDNFEYKKIDVSLSPIEELPEKTYLPCNPSICRTENGYLVICRTVNYVMYIDGEIIRYKPICANSISRNKSILVHYDKNFNKIKETPITDYSPKYFQNKIGPADCRIFRWGNEYWFTGATHDTRPYGVSRIALGNLKNIDDNKQVKLDELITLAGPNKNRYEKNWLPLVRHNNLYMIYSYDPFIIFHVAKNGLYKVVINKNQEFDLSQFRGSAAPISFKEGYLLVVHEIKPPIIPKTVETHYYHRFVYLDSNLNIQKISNRFTFKDQPIEYVCGMTLDHSNQTVILSLGIWDREAYLCFMDSDYVCSLLKAVY